jgi:TolB protein
MREHRSLRLALLLVAACAAAPAAIADDRPSIVVTPGAARTYRAAIQRFADASNGSGPQRAERFREAVARALAYSNVFEVVPEKAFLGPEVTVSIERGPGIVCSDWSQIGADAFLEGEIRRDVSEFSVEFRVWDTARCVSLLRKRYRQAITADPSLLARRIADDVVEAFIGLRGVSSTEIAFVSTRGGNPEVYVMAADGSNPRAATANRSINNFPSWSPDGDAIVYTSYRYGNFPLLYLSTRGRGRPGPVLRSQNGKHPQYRGVFDPKGRYLAVVMSPDDSSEIFRVRPDGSGLKRLTRNRAIDISPTWSPDGSKLAFVSDRTGAPQVYVMDSDGSNVRRLTYQGSYNTNPQWSPDGEWIAYETRVGGQFDIWLIDPEGTVNVPLVTHPRSDEAPTWAPNGRKLAFSSTRRGRADIYVMEVGGENLLRLTEKGGDNTSPSWGPFPR